MVRRRAALFASRPDFWTVMLLCLLGILAYGNSLGNPFIWDDEWLILRNPWLGNWHQLPRLLTADLFHFAPREAGALSGYYRPLQSLSYFADYALWRLNPFGYHATNLFFHVLNAYLLFSFARRFICPTSISLLAACLFLVHPIQTEAVAYLPSRGILLSATACLLALRCFAESQSGETRHPKKAWYAASLLGFGLGMLSAEWAAVFPLFLIAYCFFGLRRSPSRSRIVVLLPVVPFIGVLAAYFCLRLSLPGIAIHLATLALDSRSPLARCLAASQAVVVYLRLLIAPTELYFDRLLPDASFSSFAAFFPLLTMAAFFIAAAYLVPRQSAGGFSLLWFLIGLLPFSNYWPVIGRHLHEHWLYFPSMGFFLLTAQAAMTCVGWLRKEKTAMPQLVCAGLTAAVLAGATLLTIRRNAEYADPILFYATELRRAPYNVRAANNLAMLYQEQGNTEQAIAWWNQALRFKPDLCLPRTSLAMAEHQKGRTDKAIQMLRETLQVKPSCVAAMVSLGTLLFERGDRQAAVWLWKQAIAIQPDEPAALHNLRLAGMEAAAP